MIKLRGDSPAPARWGPAWVGAVADRAWFTWSARDFGSFVFGLELATGALAAATPLQSAVNQGAKPASRRTVAPRKPRAPLERALVAFAALARRERLRWYVFGAQAVGFHGFSRASLDLDITIDLGERRLGPLVAELARAGFAARFSDDAFIAATRVLPIIHTASQLPIDRASARACGPRRALSPAAR